jgi:hypothetical protein
MLSRWRRSCGRAACRNSTYLHCSITSAPVAYTRSICCRTRARHWPLDPQVVEVRTSTARIGTTRVCVSIICRERRRLPPRVKFPLLFPLQRQHLCSGRVRRNRLLSLPPRLLSCLPQLRVLTLPPAWLPLRLRSALRKRKASSTRHSTGLAASGPFCRSSVWVRWPIAA